MDHIYDRAAEDVGNIVHLEHVNLRIPEQRLATLFYVSGLGLTRDPYLMTGIGNMWVNVGRSQFHLPQGEPQLLRGHVAIVLPSRAELLRRLAAVRRDLEGTRFAFHEHEDHVEATCPWGNRICCYEPQDRFGPVILGMPVVECDVPLGSAEAITRFYREIIGARAIMADRDGLQARIAVGIGQELVFRETDRPIPPYDGHHIQIYLAGFSGPHRRLLERELITEESDQHQYRFRDIVDPDSGRQLFTLEHEVRSMRHPLYARPLVNRNPDVSNTRYAPGHEALTWSLPPSPDFAAAR